MRRIQGLAAIAIALFAVKFEFYPEQAIPESPWFLDTSPPWNPELLILLFKTILSIGCYLLITGEFRSWFRPIHHSHHTTVGLFSLLIAVFAAKWSFADYYPTIHEYYPPFDEESLGALVFGLLFFAGYSLLRGEFQYWFKPRQTKHLSPQSDNQIQASTP